MKRGYLVTLAIILAASLSLFGCSTSQTSSTASTGSVTTTTSGTTSETTHESYEIVMSTLNAGTGIYTISNVLAQMINEQSTWLKASAIEGMGSTVNMKNLVADPSLQATTIFFSDDSSRFTANLHDGATGDAPFNTFDFNEFKPLFFYGGAGVGYITLDPNLKTVKDLEGKRVVVDETPSGGAKAYYMPYYFENAGVNIQYEYMKKSDSIEALKDGLIDAWSAGANMTSTGWSPASGLPDLMATEDVYFVALDVDAANGVISQLTLPSSIYTIPALTLCDTQTEDWDVFSAPLWFGAHESMPDDVVQEFLRIVYDNCETFKDYYAAAEIISKQNLARTFTESELHPAAAEFYKQQGVPMGD